MKKFLFCLCIIALNIACLQAQDKQRVNSQSTSTESLPRMESEIFRQINEKREAKSLPLLRWNASAAKLARTHSLNMANGVVPLGHKGANQRFAELRKLIPGVTRYGENVAFNMGYANPVENAVEGWMGSKEHYANIMGNFNLSGVGVAVNSKGEYYFTQIFLKAKSQ